MTKPTPPKAKTRSTKPSVVNRTLAYARAVVAGKIVAGPHVRAACARHIADLKTGKERGLRFDVEKARQVFAFFESVLRLNGGAHEGDPFTLQPWQAFIVGSLFGWLKADGSRRFQTAYIEIGKGNGKSPIAAGIGLYGLIADDEPRAEIYAAATKKDQAQILFRDAVAMVDQSPLLYKRLTKSGVQPVWQLTDVRTGSWFKPISADDGQSGPRPHIALVDEVHEHKDANTINMLRAGFKGRRNPMMVEITNSGVERTLICYQHHEYSLRIVAGTEKNDAWFAYVCALDEGDEPLKDEKCWIKANPNLGVSIELAYIRGQVREAKGMPANESVVRRLNFCQWVDAVNPWISGEMWRSCEVSHDSDGFLPLTDRLKGVEPVGALDLSGSKDLTALALMWELPGEVVASVEFWTPKDTLIERAKRERVPYDVWVSKGFLRATPGRLVDYGFVAQRLIEIQQETGLRRIAFDAYRIKYLEKELDELGAEFELIPHGQGYYKSAESGLWMPHSIELLEAHIYAANPEAEIERPNPDAEKAAALARAKPLRVLKSPVLAYCIASTVTEADPKENKIFTKRKSKGRIDGSVALAMSAGLLDLAAEELPEPGIVLL